MHEQASPLPSCGTDSQWLHQKSHPVSRKPFPTLLKNDPATIDQNVGHKECAREIQAHGERSAQAQGAGS